MNRILQFVCELRGHKNMVRERDRRGSLGLRCQNCMKFCAATVDLPHGPEHAGYPMNRNPLLNETR